MDVVLQPTKQAVLDEAAKPLPAAFADANGDGFKAMNNRRLEKASGQKFYNTSRFTMDELTSEPDDIKDNLIAYINGFSPEIVDIMEHFKIYDVINNLDKNNLLFLVVERFCRPEVDLSPESVSNADMGDIYEELIRKFSEASN